MIMVFAKRDITILFCQRAEVLQIWSMPALYACLVSFLDVWRTVSPALLLIILMLWPIYMMAVRAWSDDVQSGFIDQVAVAGASLFSMALIRILLLAEVVLLPAVLFTMLVLISTSAALFSWFDVLAIFLSTYTLAALIAVVGALTVTLRSTGGLALLLLFPLLLPVLILLAVALTEPGAATAARYLLSALAIVAVPLGALATAATLRQRLSH